MIKKDFGWVVTDKKSGYRTVYFKNKPTVKLEYDFAPQANGYYGTITVCNAENVHEHDGCVCSAWENLFFPTIEMAKQWCENKSGNLTG